MSRCSQPGHYHGASGDSSKLSAHHKKTLQENPKELMDWYEERHAQIVGENKVEVYEKVLASYNKNPNGADFVFLTRTCYGGVVRFRKDDGICQHLVVHISQCHHISSMSE